MQENQTEKKSTLQVVIHSFFVVPLIIAIFAVIIFLFIRLMTSEPNSARDYLQDVKIGGTTKRWQGAFELSKLLSNSKMVPKDEMFVNEMISTFKYASNDRDARIQQYLAIAMGATKDERYTKTLIDAMGGADEGVIQACAFALGNIGKNDAIEPLKVLSTNISATVTVKTSKTGNVYCLAAVNSIVSSITISDVKAKGRSSVVTSGITLTAVRPPARFGELYINKNKVSKFKEKYKMQSGWINGGFIVVNEKFFKMIPKKNVMLEREPISLIWKVCLI